MCPGKKGRALLRVYSQIWLFLTSLDGKNISGETKTPKTLEAETITLLSLVHCLRSLPRSKQEHPVIQYLQRQHIKSKQRYFHNIYFFISTNQYETILCIGHNLCLGAKEQKSTFTLYLNLSIALPPPLIRLNDVCSVCV